MEICKRLNKVLKNLLSKYYDFSSKRSSARKAQAYLVQPRHKHAYYLLNARSRPLAFQKAFFQRPGHALVPNPKVSFLNLFPDDRSAVLQLFHRRADRNALLVPLIGDTYRIHATCHCVIDSVPLERNLPEQSGDKGFSVHTVYRGGRPASGVAWRPKFQTNIVLRFQESSVTHGGRSCGRRTG